MIFPIQIQNFKLWKMPKLFKFRFPEGWYFFDCDNTELKRSSKINFSVSERHRWASIFIVRIRNCFFFMPALLRGEVILNWSSRVFQNAQSPVGAEVLQLVWCRNPVWTFERQERQIREVRELPGIREPSGVRVGERHQWGKQWWIFGSANGEARPPSREAPRDGDRHQVPKVQRLRDHFCRRNAQVRGNTRTRFTFLATTNNFSALEVLYPWALNSWKAFDEREAWMGKNLFFLILFLMAIF